MRRPHLLWLILLPMLLVIAFYALAAKRDEIPAITPASQNCGPPPAPIVPYPRPKYHWEPHAKPAGSFA